MTIYETVRRSLHEGGDLARGTFEKLATDSVSDLRIIFRSALDDRSMEEVSAMLGYSAAEVDAILGGFMKSILAEKARREA